VGACRVLPTVSTQLSGPVFVRSADGRVYRLEHGTKRFETSMAALLRDAGGALPVLVPVSAASLSRVPSGADIL
jgi:hypothetical protein